MGVCMNAHSHVVVIWMFVFIVCTWVCTCVSRWVRVRVCVWVCMFTDMSALGNRVNGRCGSDIVAHLARSLRLEEEAQVRHDITFISVSSNFLHSLLYKAHLPYFLFPLFQWHSHTLPYLLSPCSEILSFAQFC